jgi:hypothetical protein
MKIFQLFKTNMQKFIRTNLFLLLTHLVNAQVSGIVFPHWLLGKQLSKVFLILICFSFGSSSLFAQYSTLEWARLIGGVQQEKPTKIMTVGSYTYIIGGAASTTLPVIGGRTSAGAMDVYIAKFNAAGTMIFSTYLGGAQNDQLYNYNYNGSTSDLATVVGDDIYFAGQTISTDLPVTNGTSFDGQGLMPEGGNASNWDGFVAKVNTVTGAIGFCTYFGNDGPNFSQDPIKLVVANGDVYVTWDQYSDEDWYSNPVISKFNGTTGNKEFATNFGPVVQAWAPNNYWNAVNGFQVSGNSIYVALTIEKSILATPLSTDGTVRDTTTSNMAYAKYNATTGVLEFLTYMGGSSVGNGNDDNAMGLYVYNGDTYVVGYTRCSDFPVTDGSSPLGADDIVILKYNSSNALVWAKRLGGNGIDSPIWGDYAFEIIDGKLYLIGKTRSTNFPTTNGTTKVSPASYSDAFITKMDTDGNILFSTLIGGSVGVNPQDFVLGCNEEVYLLTQAVGLTGYPITNGSQVTVVGSMLSKFDTHTGELLYSGVLDYVNAPSNIEYIENGTVQLLAMNTVAVSGAVTVAGDALSGNGDFYLAQINTCPTGYVGSTAVSPATQLVCVGGLVAQITMAPAMIPGSTLPMTYINGVPTPQADIIADYQWQVSNDGVSGWTDVPNATLQNYLPDPSTTNKYYRRIVRTTCCGVTTVVHTSDVAEVTTSANTAPIANAGGSFSTCSGTPVTIGNSTIATGGLPPYTVLWDNALGAVSQPTATPTQSTIYTLKVTDANGCSDLDQAIVTVYRANAGPDMGNCAGAGTRIGGDPIAGVPGVVYAWTASPDDPTMSCTNCAQPTVNPAVTTTYTLNMTVPVTGGTSCITTDDVVVRPTTGPATANFAGPDRVICLGSTAPLGTTPTAADATTYTPTAVSQSSVNTYTGTIANLSDGDFSTGARTTTISSWVMLDLGTVKTISEVQLAAITNVNNLNSRKLKVSTDNITWTDVLTIDGVSNTALTSFQFYPVDARYVRVSLGYSGVVEVSEFIVKESFYYTWAPSNYITDNHIPLTTFQPGSLAMPAPNAGLYYLTAIKGGCSFVDQVETAVIEARAGVDGCGPRLVGMPDRTPGLNETYTWTKISGPGNFSGATNLPQVPVTASVGGATTYELTVSYTLNGVSQSCTDQVIVPDCGCVVDIAVEAPFSCPSYSLNGGVGTVKLIATAADIFSQDPNVFSYSWSPAAGLSSTTGREVMLTDNVNRTYTVTMSSPYDPSFNCTRTIEVNHPAWSLPVFTAQDIATCPEVPVSIGQSFVAGYSYEWSAYGSGTLNSNTASNPVATANGTTDFVVLVTDIGSGCAVKDTATVSIEGLPTNPAGIDLALCGSATGVQLGATTFPGVTYTWSSTPAGAVFYPNNTVANPTVDVSITTTYNVTVTNTATGCTAVDNITVEINTPVEPFSFTNSTFCPLTAGAIPLPAGPTGMASYAWTSTSSPVLNPLSNGPTATTSNPRPQIETTYTLAVTNAQGCIGTASVTMTPTTTAPIAGSDKSLCLSEGSVTIGSASNPTGAGITYSWLPTTGLSDATSPNPIFTPTATGITTFTLTKTEGGCSASDQVQVNVMNFTLPAMSSPTICQNACIEIGTNPLLGATYVWIPATGLSDANVSNPTACPTATTTYTLNAIGANGCPASQNIGVVVSSSVAPTVSVPAVSACLGDDGVMFAPSISPAGTYNYQWSPNNGTLSNIYASNPEVYITGIGTKEYVITVTNTTTGCSNSAIANLTVTNCPPLTCGVAVLSAVPTACIPATNTYNLAVAVTYSNPPTGNITINVGGTDYTFTPNGSGSETFTVTSLTSDAVQNIDVSATFVGDAACTHTLVDAYDAPASCGCDNVTDPGTITGEQSFCGTSYDPSPITNVTLPTGGTGTMEYMWIWASYPAPAGSSDWSSISNTNTDSYDPGVLTQTTCFRRCARRVGCTSWAGESEVVCITLYPAVSVTCDKTDVTTNGGSDGTATVSATGGTSPYSYAWNSGETAASISGKTSGTYTVTVTDANGCTDVCASSINEPGALCNLTGAGLAAVMCNDNGTSADATDDYISFTLNPTGTTLGSGYIVTVSSGSITPNTGTYGTASNFQLQNGSAGSGATITVTITDNLDSNCKVQIDVADTGSCSTPTCPPMKCMSVTVTKTP